MTGNNMKNPLLRQFEEIYATDIAIAGYTSGLCGEWTTERFTLFADQFGMDAGSIMVANQHHTDSVYAADNDDAGCGTVRPQKNMFYDAIITEQAGLMLCVHTADCVPLVLLDPVNKAVGIAHSGWVGSSKRIAGKTVRRMAEVYGSNPGNIICCIGPYNHSCCYEVGEDVLESFMTSFSESECTMLFRKKDDEGKYMLDLGLAVSMSLLHEGVIGENIHDTGHCTYHTDEFSSWRRTRNKKHQILTYIMIRDTSMT